MSPDSGGIEPAALTEPRVAESWEGLGNPIMLTLHSPNGEMAVPLMPKRFHIVLQAPIS